jgi:hypothetical protein
MKRVWWLLASALVAGTAHGDPPPTASADAILTKMLESDPFGFSGATVVAHLTVTDQVGSSSHLAFTSRSKRLGPGLAESLVRFSAPPELAGAGFLQIQKKDGDDDRFLFLPDLKRSRRIPGNIRSNPFMGTDLSFADLDRRDMREASARLVGKETIEKWDCYVLDATSKRSDSPQPTLSGPASDFFGALLRTGYLFPLLKGTEVVGGALLVSGRFVPLALTMLAPIVVNILGFHLFLAPSGLGIPLLVLALEVFLAWSYGDAFRPLLSASSRVFTDSIPNAESKRTAPASVASRRPDASKSW